MPRAALPHACVGRGRGAHTARAAVHARVARHRGRAIPRRLDDEAGAPPRPRPRLDRRLPAPGHAEEERLLRRRAAHVPGAEQLHAVGPGGGGRVPRRRYAGLPASRTSPSGRRGMRSGARGEASPKLRTCTRGGRLIPSRRTDAEHDVARVRCSSTARSSRTFPSITQSVHFGDLSRHAGTHVPHDFTGARLARRHPRRRAVLGAAAIAIVAVQHAARPDPRRCHFASSCSYRIGTTRRRRRRGTPARRSGSRRRTRAASSAGSPRTASALLSTSKRPTRAQFVFEQTADGTFRTALGGMQSSKQILAVRT